MSEVEKTDNNDGTNAASVPESVYRATAGSLQNLLSEFPYYQTVIDAFNAGEGNVELRKRYMLKAVDEVWVAAVEDAIPSLDVILRNPDYLLEEKESLMPIEKTRKVTSRSIQHLSQHTDYINEIRPDGTVMPAKLLNVYQDDTIFSYENKFINTLLTRLYAFVARRYDAASECGEDEKTTKLDFSRTFAREGQTGKLRLTIEVSEKPEENAVVKNFIYTTDLWHRVEKVYRIVTSYMDSPFAHELGKQYVRPPILRTNKLLKNVEFRACLALWEFLDSYDNTGYELIVQEDLEKMDETCLSEIYNTLAEQYVIFQSHIHSTFDSEQMLVLGEPSEVLYTKFVDELEPMNEPDLDVPIHMDEDFYVPDADDSFIEKAIRIALEADKYYLGEEEDAEEELVLDDGKIMYRYRYSFMARLIKAKNPAQFYYAAIKNELLSYGKVKSRLSWNHDLFTAGRPKCAEVNVKGKTVFLYLPLNPSSYEVSRFHHVDLRAEKNRDDLDFPFLLKVRSERSLKYAIELIADVMKNLGLVKISDFVPKEYSWPEMTVEEMITANPPLAKRLDGDSLPVSTAEVSVEATPVAEEMSETAVTEDSEKADSGFTYRYRYSFSARLIRASEPAETYYSEIKNELLSYKKVKSRISWNHELFTVGRPKCAKINVKGKTLFLYLPLNPEQYEVSRYHHVDLRSEGNKDSVEFPFLIKVRSARSLQHALKLIADVMVSCGLCKTNGFTPTDYHMPDLTVEEMIAMNPPLVKLLDGSLPFSVTGQAEEIEEKNQC